MERIVASPNPYVRCIGLLYLRYTHPPAKLMEWFEDALYDGSEVQVRCASNAKKT